MNDSLVLISLCGCDVCTILHVFSFNVSKLQMQFVVKVVLILSNLQDYTGCTIFGENWIRKLTGFCNLGITCIKFDDFQKKVKHETIFQVIIKLCLSFMCYVFSYILK